MTVNHPYLKQLKTHIFQFTQSAGVIDDTHPNLLPFCVTLEDILLLGIQPGPDQSNKSISKSSHFWNWLIRLPELYSVQRLTVVLSESISAAKACQKVRCLRGRGRFWLRVALNNALLAHTVSLVLQNATLRQEFYDEQSVLANEILIEMLQSLLQTLNQCHFKLNIRNSSFLDTTWQLPGRVRVGDVLDEVCGQSVFGLRPSAVTAALLKRFPLPATMAIVKCSTSHGSLFPPLEPLLREAGLLTKVAERLKVDLAAKETESASARSDQSETNQFEVFYVGCVSTGQHGMVEEIQHAVRKVLQDAQPNNRRSAVLNLGETGLTLTCKQSEQVIVEHGYPEIASCGRRLDLPLNFAYIAGDTTCTLAEQFTCYVFQALDDQQAKSILQGIANGFKRTHWAC